MVGMMESAAAQQEEEAAAAALEAAPTAGDKQISKGQNESRGESGCTTSKSNGAKQGASDLEVLAQYDPPSYLDHNTGSHRPPQ